MMFEYDYQLEADQMALIYGSGKSLFGKPVEWPNR